VDSLIPLNTLPIGQVALVRHIRGRADYVQRLHEFGLRCGSRIEMFRAGSPCIVRLAGQKVCLRAGGPLDVMVQPLAPLPD
jgi:ferrous iron transport protein A